MSEVIQFPQETSTAQAPAESDQIITLLTAAGELKKGGEANFTDITAWKNANYGMASTYIGAVVEFSSDAEVTLGNGTLAQAIGLYGELANGSKFLIGLLGLNLGATVPQIPLQANAGGTVIGFAQLTVDISLYNKISVGGVFNIVTPAAGAITVRLRPVRDRDYIG